MSDDATLQSAEQFWRDCRTLSQFSPSRREPVRIAVLDGPVHEDHPCFKGASLRRIDGIGPHKSDEGPSCEHGTFIASLLFAQPETGLSGISPASEGLIVPIFKDDSFGRLVPCSQDKLAAAIRAALDADAEVINISGGEYDPNVDASPLLRAALENCAQRGVVVVSAVGNSGCLCPNLPAALPTVIAVGGMDAVGKPLAINNWGPIFEDHGLLAPGENIRGARPMGEATIKSGTSFATALVTGVIAELATRLPGVTPAAAAQALLKTASGAVDFTDDERARLFRGRINISAAIEDLGFLNRTDKNMTDFTPEERMVPSGRGATRSEPIAPITSIPDAGFAPRQTYPIGGSGAALVPAESANIVPASCCDGCATGGACAAGPAEATQDTPDSSGQVYEMSQNVFALGKVGYHFSGESRKEGFVQLGLSEPDDPEAMLAFLEEHPYFADRILWTLSIGPTPLYAVRPSGAFAAETYAKMRKMLAAHVSGESDRVSIPGLLGGNAILHGSQRVPFLIPDIRGMFDWSTESLISDVGGDESVGPHLKNFLERVYHELRNTGVTGAHRALNYAATNAFAFHSVFASALQDELELHTIHSEPSPIAPVGSEAYDVVLEFFHPRNRTEQARRMYRYSIDVSDVLPVLMDEPKMWHAY